MWLNYATWCTWRRRTIPGQHQNFEYLSLRQLEPEFHPMFEFQKHSADPAHSAIRLGSNRALINFYIYIQRKKLPSRPWQPELLGYCAMAGQDWNLDWCDIFIDPEQFFNQVALLTGLPLKYNQYTAQAIEQYRNTCVIRQDDLEHCETVLGSQAQDLIHKHLFLTNLA